MRRGIRVGYGRRIAPSHSALPRCRAFGVQLTRALGSTQRRAIGVRIRMWSCLLYTSPSPRD
eukprot:8310811-Alexandrium_andersonii.AAC.1